jgi:hypothetical protein
MKYGNISTEKISCNMTPFSYHHSVVIKHLVSDIFYQGLVHKGVKLPAAINFTHYTHGTGQVRSNASFLLMIDFKSLFSALAVLSFVVFESD